MKRIEFKTENSIGHIEVPDGVNPQDILNQKDEPQSGGALYPDFVEDAPDYFPRREDESQKKVGSGGQLFPTGIEPEKE